MKRPDTNRQMQRGREGRGDVLGEERSWEDGLRDVLRGNKQGSLAWAESLEARTAYVFAQNHQHFRASRHSQKVLHHWPFHSLCWPSWVSQQALLACPLSAVTCPHPRHHALSLSAHSAPPVLLQTPTRLSVPSGLATGRFSPSMLSCPSLPLRHAKICSVERILTRMFGLLSSTLIWVDSWHHFLLGFLVFHPAFPQN